MSATATTCRGCGHEIPTPPQSFPLRWCTTCAHKLPPRHKAALVEASMEDKVRQIGDRARANGNARVAAGPVAVRHDPSIIREKAYPERICRGCGDSFTPDAPARWFCEDCRR